MRSKKITENQMPQYTPKPDNEFWFYIGEKYYRKLQPVPYKKELIDFTKLKKVLSIK